ncbi:MAG: hypothetical protein DMG49_01830 [Acidobacteria bacterium]|nr:MAG: hypothetical protein DMG49_01830 [Acidobacteriota bacterium]
MQSKDDNFGEPMPKINLMIRSKGSIASLLAVLFHRPKSYASTPYPLPLRPAILEEQLARH